MKGLGFHSKFSWEEIGNKKGVQKKKIIKCAYLLISNFDLFVPYAYLLELKYVCLSIALYSCISGDDPIFGRKIEKVVPFPSSLFT